MYEDIVILYFFKNTVEYFDGVYFITNPYRNRLCRQVEICAH